MKTILLVIGVMFATIGLQAQVWVCKAASIRFFSETPVENIDATSKTAVALINTTSGQISFKVNIKSFVFPDKLMQEHFNENYMESDKIPGADFSGVIENKPDLSKDGTYNVNVKGKLTVHGVTKERTIPATITVKGGVITATSKFKVKCVDHNIEIPKIVMAKIAEEIEVTVTGTFTPNVSK